MTQDSRADFSFGSLNWLPWWWRVIVWAAMAGVSAALATQTWMRVAAAVVMIVAAVAVQYTGDEHVEPVRAVAVLTATVAGLVVILLSPRGLGYVPVPVAAGRFPYRDRRGLYYLVATTVCYGLGVAWASHSFVALLAGAAIPVVMQRAAQRAEIVAQRDQARALLAEVQAGRDAEAQAAALRERSRIARELHDVLAHTLAGLSLQLQAIRALAAQRGAPSDVTEPLDRAAELARDGLGEARRAVGALRDPGGLGLADLPALVERHPGESRLTVTGEPGTVPAEVGHAAYRAVQEALTNAARYAPGSPVSVLLDWRADRVEVRIEDAGPAPGHHPTPEQGTGLGLAGMDERLRQVGGSVTAGPRADGPGWRVELRVPTADEVAR